MKTTSWCVATLILALGCQHADPVSPPETTVGGVSGTVRLLGSAGSPPSAGQVALYESVDDFERRKAAYTAAMTTTAPQERTYAFAFAHVQPGGYYLTACFSFGCGEYRDAETGALIQVTVRAAETTTLAIAF